MNSENDELLLEVIKELRKQNDHLVAIKRKQQESTWYLWLVALILAASVILPFVNQ